MRGTTEGRGVPDVSTLVRPVQDPGNLGVGSRREGKGRDGAGCAGDRDRAALDLVP